MLRKRAAPPSKLTMAICARWGWTRRENIEGGPKGRSWGGAADKKPIDPGARTTFLINITVRTAYNNALGSLALVAGMSDGQHSALRRERRVTQNAE
jgi:hypothetical protein